MIERMLALAAVEHRQQLDAPRPVEIAGLLESVAEDSRPRLGARGQRLSLRHEELVRSVGEARTQISQSPLPCRLPLVLPLRPRSPV